MLELIRIDRPHEIINEVISFVKYPDETYSVMVDYETTDKTKIVRMFYPLRLYKKRELPIMNEWAKEFKTNTMKKEDTFDKNSNHGDEYIKTGNDRIYSIRSMNEQLEKHIQQVKDDGDPTYGEIE